MSSTMNRNPALDKEKLTASLERRYGKRVAAAGRGGGPGGGRNAGRNARGQGGKPQDVKRTIARLWKYVMAERMRMGIALVCVLISTLASLAVIIGILVFSILLSMLFKKPARKA